jgi:hypothetical protein
MRRPLRDHEAPSARLRSHRHVGHRRRRIHGADSHRGDPRGARGTAQRRQRLGARRDGPAPAQGPAKAGPPLWSSRRVRVPPDRGDLRGDAAPVLDLEGRGRPLFALHGNLAPGARRGRPGGRAAVAVRQRILGDGRRGRVHGSVTAGSPCARFPGSTSRSTSSCW